MRSVDPHFLGTPFSGHPMSELIARLEALLRDCSACDEGRHDGGQMAQQFRRDLRLLVAEYGPSAVDAALDELPDGAGAPASHH
jgi:hypothetical protein